MDSLDWKTLNSNIVIKETKKKFYNQYFYSLKIYCPAGRIILNPKNLDIAQAVINRLEFERVYNYGGSWKHTIQPNYRYYNSRNYNSDIEIKQLECLREIKNTFSEIKLRIEDPFVQIYTKSEEQLYEIAKVNFAEYRDRFDSIFRPKSVDAKKLLESGSILIKNPMSYKYKFVCKSGVCQNKRAILNYLDALGEQVKVSNSNWTLLENDTHNYIWNMWLYANDPDIANLLNIIEYNFVTNIHEVVVA